MSNETELFSDYLGHLELFKQDPTHGYLSQLQSAQLRKFPFESISKIILNHDYGLDSVVDFKTHLYNSVNLGFGGTCYANNYYFNRLLNHLGFEAKLCGADMKSGIDVHIVNIVRLEGKEYLVDVGYAAPFFEPIPLNKDSVRIKWGDLEYELTPDQDMNLHRLVFSINGSYAHEYRVNPVPRSIDHFNFVIRESYDHSQGFMTMLRIIKFFENYSIELKDFEYTIRKENYSTKYKINSIDELENIIETKFYLSGSSVKKAYEIIQLNRDKIINESTRT